MLALLAYACYHKGMPFSIDEDVAPERVDPLDIPVQLNVRIPYHYREQLVRLARERKVSLNRYVVNALVRSVPPERQ